MDLVANFLEFHGLKQTLSVLRAESGSDIANVTHVAKQLDLSVNASESLLDTLVKSRVDTPIATPAGRLLNALPPVDVIESILTQPTANKEMYIN
jgi:hypothetical protein